MTTPNILKTPESICTAARVIFPEACMTPCTSNDNPSEILLHVSNRIEPILISHAVDRKDFLLCLNELAKNLKIDSFLSSPRSRNYQIASDRFSIQTPLSGYYKFQRLFIEHNGQKCSDLIFQFLENPSCTEYLSQLRFIGLAPDQIEEQKQDEIFEIFMAIIPRMDHETCSKKTQIGRTFKSLYPHLYETICEHLARENARETTDAYQEILIRLEQKVIGQPHVTAEMASLLLSQQKRTRNRAYLFVGPPGIGKTELAKTISHMKRNRLIIISMEQYQLEYTVSKLFGSSTGLVGSTTKPHFAEELNKFSIFVNQTKAIAEDVVILFDEIEKAHDNVKQSLLNLFSDYEIDISYTKVDIEKKKEENIKVKYALKNCVLIGTSNLFQGFILQSFKERLEPKVISKKFEELCCAHSYERGFSPEFLSRVSIIPFGPIQRGEAYQKILKMKFNSYVSGLKEEFSFRRVAYEENVFPIFENKLYGDGIDIRKIEKQYFEKITMIFNQHVSKWGDLSLVKILFFADNEKIFIKVEKYISTFNDYSILERGLEIP